MPSVWEKWRRKMGERPNPLKLEGIALRVGMLRDRLPGPYTLLLFAVLAWILSGIHTIGPDEQGLVRCFGKLSRTSGPGLHYRLPFPIESVTKCKVSKVRRVEIGFRTLRPGPPPEYRAVEEEALMLTGDENIIDLWFIVQFRIKEATHYFFNVADPEKAIKDAAEAAMREVIGRNNIDEALTTGKYTIQKEAWEALQGILDDYQSGMVVLAVQLQAVYPPAPVRDAFKDVISAREEKNQSIYEAQGYAHEILPGAKGQAARIEHEALAYREEKIKQAEGDAARFLARLEEYRKAREVTRKRLYLEAMGEIVSRAQKFVIDSAKQNVVPLLPLDALRQSGPDLAGEK